MGLRADIQQAIAEAFDGDLSDVVAPFLLVQTTQGDYDTATGAFATTECYAMSRGVFTNITTLSGPTQELGDTNIVSTDQIVIVNGADLTTLPKVDDIIRTDVDYIIYGVTQTPNESYVSQTPNELQAIVYEIRVRRVAE